MIQTYRSHKGGLVPAGGDLRDAIWIDGHCLDTQEAARLESDLGIEVPTQAEMGAIRVSARLYSVGRSVHMTAILPAFAQTGEWAMGPVSFVLTGSQLVTLRHHGAEMFDAFAARATQTGQIIPDARSLLLALLDAVIDRMAESVERSARDIEGLSHDLSRQDRARPDPRAGLDKVARVQGLMSGIAESLLTLERLFGYWQGHLGQEGLAATTVQDRLVTLRSDARSVIDQVDLLSGRISHLRQDLVARLGLGQVARLRAGLGVAVACLPPTLVASLYGMNFRHMPELAWTYGYGFALGMMVLAAVLPSVYLMLRKQP